MAKEKDTRGKLYSNEMPTIKQILIVLIVFAVLIALSWVAYYKFHFGRH